MKRGLVRLMRFETNQMRWKRRRASKCGKIMGKRSPKTTRRMPYGEIEKWRGVKM